MKRPSFQFYPADWRNNAKLRRCSESARGVWVDILCVLHDMDEYGICRWPLVDLARSANVNIKFVKELVQKEVLKGADKNAEPYIYTPRHAGRDGEPVVLAENNGGALWYCSRFVRDEYVRQRRGQSTRFDSDNQPPNNKPNIEPESSPTRTIGEPHGDGPTSTSTSKPNEITHSNKTITSVEPTIAASVCMTIKQHQIPDVNPANPLLLRLIDAGATLEEFEQAAISAKVKKFSYVMGIVHGQREQAAQAKIASVSPIRKKPWFISSTGIEEKAKELGIVQRGDEAFPYFKERVYKAAGVTDEMIRKAIIDFPQDRKQA